MSTQPISKQPLYIVPYINEKPEKRESLMRTLEEVQDKCGTEVKCTSILREFLEIPSNSLLNPTLSIRDVLNKIPNWATFLLHSQVNGHIEGDCEKNFRGFDRNVNIPHKDWVKMLVSVYQCEKKYVESKALFDTFYEIIRTKGIREETIGELAKLSDEQRLAILSRLIESLTSGEYDNLVNFMLFVQLTGIIPESASLTEKRNQFMKIFDYNSITLGRLFEYYKQFIGKGTNQPTLNSSIFFIILNEWIKTKKKYLSYQEKNDLVGMGLESKAIQGQELKKLKKQVQQIDEENYRKKEQEQKINKQKRQKEQQQLRRNEEQNMRNIQRAYEQANPINQTTVGAMLKFLNLQKQSPNVQRIKERFRQLSLSKHADRGGTGSGMSQVNKNKQFFDYVLRKDPEYFNKNSTKNSTNNKAKSEQTKEEVVFDENKLDNIWNYLQLDDVEGVIYIRRIWELIDEKLREDPNNPILQDYKNYFWKLSLYISKNINSSIHNKFDEWKSKRNRIRNLPPEAKQRPNVSDLYAIETPPFFEEAPDFWLETPPQLHEMEKSTKRESIYKYIDLELKELKKNYMFLLSMYPRAAQEKYGPINYWMFSNILYQTDGQGNGRTKQERIMKYLIAKQIYEEIFKYWDKIPTETWDNAVWGEDKEKSIPKSRKQRQRLEDIKINTQKKYDELMKSFTLEDVVDYLIGMQTWENENNSELTGEQKEALQYMKEKFVYPLLFHKFGTVFSGDNPLQQMDSDLVKRIKPKLHKLRCSFFPNWLCNFLFSKSFSNQQKAKYFKKIVEQGDFGDDFKLKRVDLDKIDIK